MADFNGTCRVNWAGLNSDDGRVHLNVTAVDGTSLGDGSFLAKREQNREILAIALAAMTSNKNVNVRMRDTTNWTEIWWLSLIK
jgi:hypothetical protein